MPADNALDELFEDQERSPEQMLEQAGIEDELEADAKGERDDPDEYDERDESPAGHRPEAKADEKPEPEEDKRVPLIELIAERQKRQDLQRRLEELERAQQQPKPEAKAEPKEEDDPEPDYLDDPKAWADWRVRQADKVIADLKAKVEGTEQATAQQRQFQQFQSSITEREADFVAQTPDYYEALNFARQRAASDILASAEAMGVEVTQAQLLQELTRQELATAHAAMQRGKSPAEVVYQIAQKWGYTKAEAAAAAATAPQAKPNGSRPGARELARGMPSGGAPDETDLTESDGDGSVPSEFLAARAERFGRR